MCGNTLAAPDEAQSFVGRRLDADLIGRDAERVRDDRAHLTDARVDLRRLGENGDVHVADPPARRIEPMTYFVDELDRRAVFVAIIGGREEDADVAHARRTEQRVAERVEQHVGVGVPEEPAWGVGEVDAAEP